ncbi:hypothetical protein GGI04_002155 [Coemansia thaxteri]|nr:hypothetical protein GGI04_002155 [Coemansia thaxteri]KAJ2472599.1 hypothetical protein GGI02_001468 [Coemansia sp. RSA 2322]
MLFKITTIAVALVASVSAHMAMIEPCTRYTPNNPKCPALPAGQTFDYNMKTPIGYNAPLITHAVPYATPVETWTAGQPVTVSFQADGAAHGGGHCEFSLSYDGGKTFVVIHQELQYCFFAGPSTGNTPQVLSYTFNLPANVPSSNTALFAWSWVNAIGNREFYMNVADVAITGSSATSYTGKQQTIANHVGYPTIAEFSGDYTTGLQYYTNAPTITVTGNGGSSNGTNPVPHVPQSVTPLPPAVISSTAVQASVPVPTYVPPPVNTPVVPVYSPVSSAPASAQPTAAPQPPPSGSCTHGTMACNANDAGFKVCVWGVWSSTLSCAAGTTCKTTAPGSIACGWP